MPNRIIKESICTSDSIDKLSAFEETMFYRLIVNCDDYGRFDARPAILRSRLFPLKALTDKQIISALDTLCTSGLIYIYEVEGKQYLKLSTWENHQNIRAKKSKYPAPDDGCIKHDNICNQMQADDDKPQSKSKTSKQCTGFDEFWELYPKKVSKATAQKAFYKHITDDLLPTVLNALKQQKKSPDWARDGGKYIPYPATWLNGKRWEDQLYNTPNFEDYSGGESFI